MLTISSAATRLISPMTWLDITPRFRSAVTVTVCTPLRRMIFDSLQFGSTLAICLRGTDWPPMVER